MKKILIVSPHLDDAVLSLGDFIYKNINNGNKVDVLTIFSGTVPKEDLSEAAKKFHSNCFLDENSMKYRKEEDKKSHDFLGCTSYYLDLPECLYRKNKGSYLYPELSNIYHLEDNDKEILDTLYNELNKYVYKYDEVYAPMGLGGHADHLAVNKSITKLYKNMKFNLFFYEEVAYVCYYYRKRKTSNWGDNLKYKYIDITDKEFNHGLDAILIYRSQLNILWKNLNQLLDDLNVFSYKYSKDNKRMKRLWYYED